jgi:hypothetical protein
MHPACIASLLILEESELGPAMQVDKPPALLCTFVMRPVLADVAISDYLLLQIPLTNATKEILAFISGGRNWAKGQYAHIAACPSFNAIAVRRNVPSSTKILTSPQSRI